MRRHSLNALLKTLEAYIQEEAGPGPGSFLSIGAEGLKVAEDILKRKPAETMIFLLGHGLWPRRFIRNRGIMTAGEQAKLLASKAAVIGCGGLGGYVVTLLARSGIGSLSLCDRDCFDESNLNRQLLSRETNLGRNKAEAAGEELAAIASHVEAEIWPEAATPKNLPRIINNADVVLDCLDSIATRRQVESAAHTAGLPFIHGSIAGYEGFAMTTRAKKNNLSSIYGNKADTEEKNAEHSLGTPAFTPASLACLQLILAINELLGRETGEDALLHMDLSVPSIESLYLQGISKNSHF